MLVNQALSAALELLFHDYRLLVCQLEQSLTVRAADLAPAPPPAAVQPALLGDPQPVGA